MKKTILPPFVMLCMILALITTSTFAQIEFEKGYVIDSNNQKSECLIRNIDWANNPERFLYKLTADGVVQTGDVQSIKEFSVYGYSKYISAHVKIDRSPYEVSKLTTERNPVWTEEDIFLKVISEGKISLLYYGESNLRHFFYKSDNTIEQLVYKRYKMPGKNAVGENSLFKQQLWNYTRDCKNVDEKLVSHLSYDKTSLENYFARYNECYDVAITNLNEVKKKKTQFDLKAVAGLNYISSYFEDHYNRFLYDDQSVTFESKTAASFGLELEAILPINKNKWGVFLAPRYFQFKSERQTSTIQCAMIEVPLGVRYYAFLNKHTRLFFDLSYARNIVAGKSEVYAGYPQPFKIGPTASSLTGGAGLEFHRFSGEIKYVTCNDLLGDYSSWQLYYNRISLELGVRLFRNGNK
jgi:hypothetical protein